MYKLSFIRDRIVLDADLKNYIVNELKNDAPSMYPGRKVLLVAREVIITNGYHFELPDCDLVIVADHFNHENGTIQLKVTQVPAIGQPGYPGRNCTIACRTWTRKADFVLKGGPGGIGLTGDPGTPGKDGTYSLAGKNGKDGGKGGTGKTGGTGGKGGKLTIMHVGNPRPIMGWEKMVPGGIGGAGGNGGPGGAGGEGILWCKKPSNHPNDNDGDPKNNQDCFQGLDGKKGPKGDVGKTGAQGATGTASYVKFEDVNAFYNALPALGVSKKEWANYRFKAGEYYFRTFNAANPHHLQLALSELEAVIKLDPQNTQATTYIKQILNNQNILGLSRQADIIPDFDHYETVYSKYYPMVDSTYKSSTDMLLNTVTFSQMKTALDYEIEHLDGLIETLTDELKAAILGKEIADKEFTKAKQRVEEISKMIHDKKEELENAEVDLFGAIIGTVGLVASLIAAIPSMGASLASAAASIGVIFDAVDQLSVNIMSEAADPAGNQTAIDNLKKNAKGLKGFVEEVAKGVKLVLDFPKMLEDAWAVKVDDEGYRQLIVQSVELAHQQLLAGLHQQQAQYTMLAAEKRLELAKDDRKNAGEQLDELKDNIFYLKRAALFLMRTAQNYTTILSKYAFYAARSLEIYTFADKSKDICFDYGYLHPDLEANYENGLVPLIKLVEEYAKSWSRFGNLLTYREQYDNYFNTGSWVHDYHRLSITDSATLNDFKQHQQLNLTVSLADLPPTRFEAKANTIYIAFIGATSQSGVITAVVEHSGIYSERTRDGKDLFVTLNPRSGTITARTSPLKDAGVVLDPEQMEFRGRGLATNWYIHIEPIELEQQNIDLSQLSEIQVWFGYQSFLVNAFANIPDGALIEDTASSMLYVTYGGAKLPVSDKNKLSALGLQHAKVDRSKSREFVAALTTIPKDKTLLKEHRSGKLYLVKKGVKLEISNQAVLRKMGLKPAEEKVVTEEALDLLPYGGVLK